ncbi:MAG: MucB/RseB C-terminal domain-containing protein [Sulfuriferula sp.]
MRLWFVWIVFISLPVWAANNETSADLNVWLNQVATAAQRLDYDGTVVYQYNDDMEISHIAHRMDHTVELFRQDALSGAPHSFLRLNDGVYCYIPEGNQVRIERHQHHQFFPEILPIPATHIAALYILKAVGHAQIANHDSRGVSLTPRDAYRYGYVLWADSNSNLLLKFIKLNEHQQPVEQFAFTQINIGSAPSREQFQSGFAGKKPIIVPSRESAHLNSWHVDTLPPGFHKITQTQLELPNKPQGVLHLVYTDGLATVSLFIEPLAQLGKHPPRGLSSHGMMSIYARPIGEYQVTALGEVPPATLIMITDSLNLTEPK